MGGLGILRGADSHPCAFLASALQTRQLQDESLNVLEATLHPGELVARVAF